MRRIAVVDVSAEVRNKLLDDLSDQIRVASHDIPFIPRISFTAYSPEEIKFQAAPDLLVVGPELLKHDITELGRLRKIISHTPCLALIDESLRELSHVEQLARFGADDVLLMGSPPSELLQKIVLLTRRAALNPSSGKLMVLDGAKGGIGVTSVSAALAEALFEGGKSVTLVDGDSESQDLSRFLQVRPFVNENVRMLLDDQRAVSEESVEQCLYRVWHDEPNFLCMTPFPENESSGEYGASHARTFLSILEVLDARSDVTIVDVASLNPVLRRAIYRVADTAILLVNSDPASLYASVERIGKVRSALPVDSRLTVLENSSLKRGLRQGVLRSEFNRAAQLDEDLWASATIPYCAVGQRWPGSGGTLFSQSKRAVRQALCKVLEEIGYLEKQENPYPYFAKAAHFLKVKLGENRIVANNQIPHELYAPKAIPQLPQPTAQPKPLPNPERGSEDAIDLISLPQFT